MTDIRKLCGCGTALVTPFTQAGEVDEDGLHRLVQWQIDEGVNFLVACGTTGESVTLSSEEQTRVVSLVVHTAAGRVPVLAGAGGYHTHAVMERIRCYADTGADGILSVTPYYNRPTPEGLFQHYQCLATNSPLPIILYNVPGRTACNLKPDTVVRLASHPNILGIKEASGDISQIGELVSLVDPTFLIFAGDDSVTLPVVALGGVGVISVASNLVPRRVAQLTRACLDGRYYDARRLNRELTPLFKALFIESNPIPIKAAMAMNGLIEEVYRLPLVPLTRDNRERLKKVLTAVQVLHSTDKTAR